MVIIPGTPLAIKKCTILLMSSEQCAKDNHRMSNTGYQRYEVQVCLYLLEMMRTYTDKIYRLGKYRKRYTRCSPRGMKRYTGSIPGGMKRYTGGMKRYTRGMKRYTGGVPDELYRQRYSPPPAESICLLEVWPDLQTSMTTQKINNASCRRREEIQSNQSIAQFRSIRAETIVLNRNFNEQSLNGANPCIVFTEVEMVGLPLISV